MTAMWHKMHPHIMRYWKGEEPLWRALLFWWIGINALLNTLLFTLPLKEPAILIISVPTTYYFMWSLVGIFRTFKNTHTITSKILGACSFLLAASLTPFWVMYAIYLVVVPVLNIFVTILRWIL